jgi:hypothetical protein
MDEVVAALIGRQDKQRAQEAGGQRWGLTLLVFIIKTRRGVNGVPI